MIQGPDKGPKLFTFTSMSYVDDTTGVANVFGPTMRVRRGTPYV